MGEYLLISDAAKEVQVESHVLRYWEEELHLPIKRNELGHRYYTKEDVERFRQIKSMKERGLQLKAIKMILRDGRLDVLPQEESSREQGNMQQRQSEQYIGKSTQQKQLEQYVDREAMQSGQEQYESRDAMQPKQQEQYMDRGPAIEIIGSRNMGAEMVPESREDKSKRLQWLLQQLIRETLLENNQELCREIKESVVKELDYQFRAQEEREEERERRQEERGEVYYQKMDELLRSKSSALGKFKKEKPEKAKKIFSTDGKNNVTSISDKKKRHFLF